MSKMNTAVSGAAAGASVGGPWGAAIGGVGGYLMGSDDESGDTLSTMLNETKNIPLPVLKEYYPELYKQVVSLNPELETAVELGPSAMEGVSTDPALKQAQLRALQKMQEVGDGGMTFQDKANLNSIQNEVNSNTQAQEGAIMQNLAARGMSGGGNELVARQMAAQQGANRQAQMGMDVKAQAERRALEALMQSGQMAGNMQAQDFGQQSQVAQAKDAISRFNTQNQQQVITNNTGVRNNAQQWNAQSAQSNANSNVEARNQAQERNLGLEQQQYDNKLAKTGLANNASRAVASSQYTRSKDHDQFLGGAISAGATAYAANNKKKP